VIPYFDELAPGIMINAISGLTTSYVLNIAMSDGDFTYDEQNFLRKITELLKRVEIIYSYEMSKEKTDSVKERTCGKY